ncbi:hypothetical protein [Paenibacillus ginsengarvi]|uniref:glycan biosynthesis hexose transferase WsfD n=1 Tax=Paenibacillus ginsengarvi TaxID=400777 RepID=UPI0018734B8D|nr:hypothetical protein [Paenibacillus ginsengarvi]
MTTITETLRIRHIGHRLGSAITPSVFAALAVLSITGFALFIPPYIGMADNGDFFRSIYSNGLYFSNPDYDQLRFGHFVRQYGIFQYYNENASMIFSSQALFLKAAIFLNKLLFHPAVFDIRFQAILYTLLYTAGVYLLVEAVTWRVSRKRGFLIAGLAVFVFGDTAYTAYFNSFYGESVILVAVLFMSSSWLLLYRRRYNDYTMLALFVVSALILTTSKQQNAPVGLIVAVLGLALIWIREQTRFRILTACSLVVLFLSGIVTYMMISDEFVNVNQYHAMTRGVLMQTPDPDSALKSLGIDEQYAILKGTIHYEPYATVDVNSELLQKEFYSKYSFVSILFYYIQHPDQLGSILQIAAKNAFTIRPGAMGNYELSAGKPFGAHTSFFSAYSFLKENAAPKTFGFIVLWALVVVGLYAPTFVTAVIGRNVRLMQRMLFMVTMMLIGLAGICVSIVGAGDADLAKHEFLFTLAFDIVTFLTVADVVGRRLFREADEPAQHGPRIPHKGVTTFAAQKSM